MNKTKTANFSYQSAGVDINEADSAKQKMASHLETSDQRVLNRLGAFASLVDIKFPEMENPVLVLKMEEPGSKQLLAAQYGRLPEIGYDLVNHLINDTVVMGAKPLAVLDTIVCGKLEKETVVELVRVMAEACKAQGCTLVGGETSEQPRVLPNGSYILSAACAGIVDRNKIVDGSKIKAGDKVLAVASNGIHTNGYTLIRTLLDEFSELANEDVAGERFIDQVLKPHVCYNQALQNIFTTSSVNGLAHITGGGIVDNSQRILPAQLDLEIDLSLINVLPVFKKIKQIGNVSDADMLRTYNLGVGLVAFVVADQLTNVQSIFAKAGQKAYEIGQVLSGNRQVRTINQLAWE